MVAAGVDTNTTVGTTGVTGVAVGATTVGVTGVLGAGVGVGVVPPLLFGAGVGAVCTTKFGQSLHYQTHPYQRLLVG